MKIRPSFFLITILLSVHLYASASAQTSNPKMLMPIGGGYSDIYTGFSEAVVSRATNRQAKILVLPIPYATNPETITEAERADNLLAANNRRFEIEEACKRSAPPEVECQAILAPILVRADAQAPDVLQYFSDDLTAIFILGGDQTVAMRVITDTPVETALSQAYERGVIIAGTSAGGGLQAAAMLAGYNLNFAAGNSLEFGATDVWNTSEMHGLLFGIQNAILDQHFYQRSRFGRLLNAISLPDVPHIGIGVDAYTGVHAPNGEVLEDVFGLYTVTILDADTYQSANAARYQGSRNIISMRNVLVHLLSPGASAYNLTTKQHSLGAPQPRIERSYEALRLPPDAGAIILAGNLDQISEQDPILARFVNLCGGSKANILIVASGYPSDSSAQRAADKYKAALPVPAQTLILSKDATQAIELPEAISGLIFIGRDQSRIQPELLAAIKNAWLSGVPLLADNAAAAAIGAYYSVHGPTPEESEEQEAATQKSFIFGNTTLRPGLGLLNLTVEPQIMSDNRWGRVFSLAYNHPDLLTIGLTDNTAIEITANSSLVIGDNAVFVFDLRNARLDLGANQGFVIANGLLDIFAPDEIVLPQIADTEAAPIHAPTPIILAPTETAPAPTPTSTATEKPTSTLPALTAPPELRPQPTRTPRPTSTPLAIPPPADPVRSNWMIVLSIAAVLIVFLGVWLNRRRLQ